MAIASVSFAPCIQRQEDPNWRFALAAYPTVEGWLVSIREDDGAIGHGYAQSLPHIGSTYHGVKAALDLLGPLLVGMEATSIAAIMTNLDRALVGNEHAKAGIDCALHDLVAQHCGVPLYDLFGGKTTNSVPQIRIVPIKTPEEMAGNAVALVEKGYRYLKIKVHGDVVEDVARVSAIRHRVGPETRLTIDANQAYTPKAAIAALRRMEEFDIDLVEQPVRANDLAGLELVTRSVTVAVEADESAQSLRDVLFLVSNRIVDAISLKIPKMGGLRNVFAAARICEAGDIRYRMGAIFGPRIHAAQALHLSAALPGLDYACELAEFDHLLDDPFDGLEVDNGDLYLSDAVGSGVFLRDN